MIKVFTSHQTYTMDEKSELACCEDCLLELIRSRNTDENEFLKGVWGETLVTLVVRWITPNWLVINIIT